MAEAKKSTTKSETPVEDKKPVTPREDPIARASRLLEETIEKAKAKASEQLDKAREDLAASQRNVDKAIRVRDERAARVERLEANAQGNAAHSYAAALGQTEIVESFEVENDELPAVVETPDED